MANEYVNKVIYGNRTLIDLTGDTVQADKILSGYTAHDKSGAPVTGSCNFDVNSQDGTAAVAEILTGNLIYNLFKDNDEDREHRIIQIDTH